MTLKEILGIKGSAVFTIQPHETIRQALDVLVSRKIGALIVVDAKQKPVGILSERDLMRVFREHPAHDAQALQELPVNQFMTRKLICGRPEDDIQHIMNIMTNSRIRHVPVIADGRLAGLVSIGDIVKSLLQDSEHEIQTLKEFIYGPGI